NTYYVDELDPGKLMRTGIDAIMNSLDPYTNYFSETQIEGYRFITEGKFNGIGVNFRRKEDYLVIMSPIEGSPAAKAGLKAGDVILEVDGKSAKNRTEEQLNEILQGFPGTEVKLKINRPGSAEQLISVKREEVTPKNVPHYEMVTPEVGYIVLTTFTAQAGDNVAHAFMDLKAKNPGMKGLILDLRENGGGLLNEAVNICNIFVPKGEEIVSTRGKVKEWNQTYQTVGNSVDEKMPLVILVNKHSASASEIVSGAIQDLDRGVIMGQLSYGKGLVQNYKDIGYNAKIKLTTAKYYIPSGRCIQAISYKNGEVVHVPDSLRVVFKTKSGRKVLDGGGIMPDVEVKLTDKTDLFKALDENLMIFDFATQYSIKNPSISPAEQFYYDDFNGFQQFLKEKKFKYETNSEKMLTKVSEESVKENISNNIKSEVSALKSKLEQEKEKDLINNKDRILTLISSEIASRYYYEKGRVQVKLKNDPEVKEAVSLLNDPVRYNKLLK
ncbi:MAG TPA: S41 family peptidase, partial [Saprospiraceae bacterium]|nr:S41 family peptidase [Saprospiraceae bacterium]